MDKKNWKIDKINAYRKLLDTKKLPKVEKIADRTVESELIEEFTAWAENQISSLLGEETTTVFTSDETVVLKHFAKKLLAQASGTPQAPAAPAAPTKTVTRPAGPENGITESDRRIIERARPLRQNEGRVLNKQEQSLVDRLEKMDQEGPEY